MTRASTEVVRIGLATAAGCWEVDEDAAATLEALAARGAEAEPLVWDDPAVDWSAWDLVVVRSTWDYVGRREEFLRWARRVASVTALANEVSVLEWNTDKRYLRDLAADGVPVVPTAFVTAEGIDGGDARATDDTVSRAIAPDLRRWSAEGVDEVVVKPTVSAGAKDTVRLPLADERVRAHASALLAAGRDVMVQPYLAGVDDSGETGLVHFSGVRSHAFRKEPLLSSGGEPVEGLFAPETITHRIATPHELRVADAALEAVRRRFGDTLYARVDLVPGGDGPVLLELELCEPSFFLGVDPGAADRFAAAAVATALSAATRRRT